MGLGIRGLASDQGSSCTARRHCRPSAPTLTEFPARRPHRSAHARAVFDGLPGSIAVARMDARAASPRSQSLPQLQDAGHSAEGIYGLAARSIAPPIEIDLV